MEAQCRRECPLPPRKRRGTPRALQAILGRLFFAPTGRFVDDLFGVDPEEDGAGEPLAGAAGASRVTRFVIETLLGWELDEEKRVSSAESAEVLGVTVAVINEPVRHCRAPPGRLGGGRVVGRLASSVAQEQALAFSIPPEKVAKWRGSIEQVLQSGQLSPAGAAKLAGKLGWGASAVFGRGARVYLAPLFHWSTGRRTVLTTRLRRTLEWWLRFLAATPQRHVPLRWRAKQRVLVYSDATGGGRSRALRAVPLPPPGVELREVGVGGR